MAITQNLDQIQRRCPMGGPVIEMNTAVAALESSASSMQDSITAIEADVAALQSQTFEGFAALISNVTTVQAVAGKELLADLAVPAGKKVLLEGFAIQVNGATAWSGDLTKLSIQDSNGTPIVFADIAVGALTANAIFMNSSSNVTPKVGMVSAGTLIKGLVLKSDDAIAAGSNLNVRIWGRFV